jgi:hypothetical protein
MEQPEALEVPMRIHGRVVGAEALGKPDLRPLPHQKAVMASNLPLQGPLLTTLVVELDFVSIPPQPEGWVVGDHPLVIKQVVQEQQIQEEAVAAAVSTAVLDRPAQSAAPAARAWSLCATWVRPSAMSVAP